MRRSFGKYQNLKFSCTCVIFHIVSKRQVALHSVQAGWKSDLYFLSSNFDLSVVRKTVSLFNSKDWCMSFSKSNIIKMVPSYSADLVVCIVDHCCLCSELKSLSFLALQNQPSSGQVSRFLSIVSLIKLFTPYQLVDQSVNTLIVNKGSWISSFFPFSVSMSEISSCVRDQGCLHANNPRVSLLAEISWHVGDAL